VTSIESGLTIVRSCMEKKLMGGRGGEHAGVDDKEKIRN